MQTYFNDLIKLHVCKNNNNKPFFFISCI